VVVSDQVGFRLGLAALEVSLRNTLVLAEAGQISPEAAELLLEAGRFAHSHTGRAVYQNTRHSKIALDC
jgi:hypothetical protein